MSNLPPANASSLEYWESVCAGDCDVVAAVEHYLEVIEHADQSTSALLELTRESALTDAHAAQQRLAAGESPRPLEGVPFTAKGNIATTAGTTTAASQILTGYQSAFEATAVARLRRAGAILVGKTNLDEFGMGSSTENSSVQATRNPWQLDRVPGGSSGGAAALAAAHGWGFHLGSDTGGSIRQPAAFCGVTGLKPTYGRVSRYGLLSFASSLDQIGPLTRSADDAGVVLAAMAGHDAYDATTLVDPWRPNASSQPLRIGVPTQFFAAGVDDEVARAVRDAAAQLEADGCELVTVSLPYTEYANACYQVVSTAEVSSNLSRFDGVHYGQRGAAPDLGDLYANSRAQFGAEVRRRILLGTFVLSAGYHDAYYRRALRVRTLIREDFDAAFAGVDVLLGPTSPVAPFPLGDKIEDPLALYACDVLTVSANLAGVPALSLPCGLDVDGLPIGLQLHAARGDEGTLLRVASRYQELTDHHRQLAPSGGGQG
ncbi:MAG: Asp-tRNA(Asn)/Glu-tRNA(Gln) amidotransferase subunit GatA [Planctomycetota bacterium]